MNCLGAWPFPSPPARSSLALDSSLIHLSFSVCALPYKNILVAVAFFFASVQPHEALSVQFSLISSRGRYADSRVCLLFTLADCPSSRKGVGPGRLGSNERSEVGSGGAAALQAHGNGGMAAAHDADSRDSAPAESWEFEMKPDSWAPGWIKRAKHVPKSKSRKSLFFASFSAHLDGRRKSVQQAYLKRHVVNHPLVPTLLVVSCRLAINHHSPLWLNPAVLPRPPHATSLYRCPCPALLPLSVQKPL
uniref:Uncharacterized protein n=1 Tax=Aegilops tauschii TaxID=37682 RepID=N1QSL3_AEGTA